MHIILFLVCHKVLNSKHPNSQRKQKTEFFLPTLELRYCVLNTYRISTDSLQSIWKTCKLFICYIWTNQRYCEPVQELKDDTQTPTPCEVDQMNSVQNLDTPLCKINLCLKYNFFSFLRDTEQILFLKFFLPVTLNLPT